MPFDEIRVWIFPRLKMPAPSPVREGVIAVPPLKLSNVSRRSGTILL